MLFLHLKRVTNSVFSRFAIKCLNVYFIIFNNYLPNGLNSNVKVFADDTSLFSVAHNINDSANLLNSDLFKIDEWALQWKMSFNLDPTKQAQ